MPLINRKHSTVRASVHDWLEPDLANGINLFSGTIIFLVVLSLVSFAIETEAVRSDTTLEPWVLPIVQQLNVIVVWIFAAEFLLRFWSEGENPAHKGLLGRLRFLVEPVTVADILGFLPEFIAVLFFPDTTAAWFPALRALRLFRLFKLARYVPAFAIVGAAVKRAWAPLVAALCVAGAQLYVAAMMLYFIEGTKNPDQFGSIARSMWWAVVTLTTVGYGDVYPETPLGRIAAALVALAGVGIVALPTGILASAFAQEFRERHEAEQAARRAREAAKHPH